MITYSAFVTFLPKVRGDRSETIRINFTADGPKQAVLDALAWAYGRTEQNLWGEMFKISVHQFCAKPIVEGQLSQDHTSFGFYEWRADIDLPAPKTIEEVRL